MNPRRVVIVGAGIGGLAAAVRLARLGLAPLVLEARSGPGGLAAGLELEGLCFDAGPYVLLDRPGLEWAFEQLGLDLAQSVPLQRIEEVYEVARADGPPVRFFGSLGRTADALEETWPGAGRRYRKLVESAGRTYHRLQPLQRVSRPGVRQLLATGAWRSVPFLLRSLESVLRRTGLPQPAVDAIAVWTHVAGQQAGRAPSPMAFVPAVIHRYGAWVPAGGVRAVAEALADAARATGVKLRYDIPVRAIRCEAGRVRGVDTAAGESIPADCVVSDAHGVGTYLELIGATPSVVRNRLAKLPLQSPGVCAYLAVRGKPAPPYLKFRLPGGGKLCRLLVDPASAGPESRSPSGSDGWRPVRLIAPMDHAEAERTGAAGQEAYLRGVLEETWWQEHVEEFRVLSTRIPAEWGREFRLHRQSMNPVMTARFMRSGRLAHKSAHVRGLYLAGSSTHPGQWVSFCAISGILAAGLVEEDLR